MVIFLKHQKPGAPFSYGYMVYYVIAFLLFRFGLRLLLTHLLVM